MLYFWGSLPFESVTLHSQPADNHIRRYMDIGARIRYFRKLKSLSQEKLAWEAGINPAFLGELERGQKSLTLKTLEKITDALSIQLYELFAGPGTLPDENDKELSNIMESLRALPPQQIHQMSVIIQTILEMKNSSI